MKVLKTIAKLFATTLITTYYFILFYLVKEDLYIQFTPKAVYNFQLVFIFVLSILGFITVITGNSKNRILVTSLILTSIIPIVNSVLAWGNNILGHEDYGRDLRWAMFMSENGAWRPEFAGGYVAYALFPAHSFAEYLLSVVPKVRIELTGIIYLITAKMLILLFVYTITKNLINYNERTPLVNTIITVIYMAISLTVAPGTAASAQIFAIALLHCYLLVLLSHGDSLNHMGSPQLIALILFTVAITVFHVSAALLIIVHSLAVSILTFKNANNRVRYAYIALTIIPIAYYILNQYVYIQVSGFVRTIIDSFLAEVNKHELTFVATVEFYSSKLWLLVYYELFFVPLSVVLLFFYLTKKPSKIKDNAVILLLLAVSLVIGMGGVAAIVTWNSTYYRYLTRPYTYLLVIVTVYLLTHELAKQKIRLFKLLYLMTLYTITLVLVSAAFLTNLHHTAAPLLHRNMDIVADLRKSINIKTIYSLADLNYIMNRPGIGIGINPYGTSDYWVIRYNVLQGNIPNGSFIIATSYKQPLGTFLTKYFVQSGQERSCILYNDGALYLIQYS